MIDEVKFFAWLDGELPEDEAAEVKRQVEADPNLQRKADQHRALTAGLRNAFGPVAEAPLAPQLTNALASSAEGKIVSLAEVRQRREARSAPFLWKQLGAVAATLALGILVGIQLASDPASLVHAEGGRLVAGGELESALHAQLASAPANHGPRIGMTFRDRSGAVCRTFADHAASGLACHEGGDWRIRGLFQGAEGQSTEHRMAAGLEPRLLELVDASIAGEPFDAAHERKAQREGWR